MKLFIKQKVFSWGDKFAVKNENGDDMFFIQGEVFSIGKKLHIYDTVDNEVAFIKQKVVSFLPRFFITVRGEKIAQVVKKISILRQKYTVSGLNWEIIGDFLAHEYSMFDANGTEVVTVTKQWLAWGDTYEIAVDDSVDPVTALSVLLVIDACMAQEEQQAGVNINFNSNDLN